MTILNRIASNWSFQEREKINNNWAIIEGYLSNLQGQINLLTGDVNIQELIDQLNQLLSQSNLVLEELESALDDVETIISNVQNATDEANNAAQSALNAISDIQSMIDNFQLKGTYDSETIYSKNNSVLHEGSSYIYINDTPSTGNPPPNYPLIANDYWHMTAAKGASGDGAVSKVNGKEPNGEGEIILTPSDIGAPSTTKFDEHSADNVRHVTAEEKGNWNAMLRAVTVGGSNEDANNPVASAILTSGIAKGAPDSGYWYIFTFTYGGGGGATPNMGQIAIAYLNNGSRGSDMRSRYKFGGEWSTWSPSFHLPTPVNAVLATGWYVNTGEALTYYKDGFGIVHVSGRVRRTDGNTSRRVTTLPVGYRPTKAVQSQVSTSITGSGYIDIDTSGNIDVWLDGTTNVNALINATFTTTV